MRQRKTIQLLFILAMLMHAHFIGAQEPVIINRSNNKIVLEGKVYYVHVVKSGHTLYSIAKAYNISEKEIVIENPGVSSDLRLGQVLKIPAESASTFSVNTQLQPEGENRHVVKEGETLFSISREHKVPVDEILQLNPDLDVLDMPIGMVLILPGAEENTNELSFDEEGIILHEVKRGETYYSLSRYYEVSVREIRSLNPQLGWGGPRAGEVLKIPKPNSFEDDVFAIDSSFLEQTVEVPLDSVVEEEVYDYAYLDEYSRFDRRTYKIAFLIPFDYSEMEPLDSLLKNVVSPLRRDRITEDYKLEAAAPKAVNFLEFFEGSLLALDSLSDAGVKLNVQYYDTHKSMHEMRQLLAEPEMQDMDLIIGPFYAYNLDLVSEFSRQHRIPLITPFHSGDSLLNDNPFLFQVNPSQETEFKRNARYIARSYDDNLIFVHSGDSSDADKIRFYKETLFSELENYSALESVLFKEVIISKGNTESLMDALKPDMRNLVILPTTDEAFASQVATTLNYQLETYDIDLFGSSYWVGFDDIEISYIHALNLTISHSVWYDYSDSKYSWFLKKYRKNYFREPLKKSRNGTSFGVLGYDMTLYFVSALDKFGPRFIVKQDRFSCDETITDFQFERISKKGGYENISMKYYNFTEDINVVEVDLPPRPPLHHYMRPAKGEHYFYQWTKPLSDTLD